MNKLKYLILYHYKNELSIGYTELFILFEFLPFSCTLLYTHRTRHLFRYAEMRFSCSHCISSGQILGLLLHLQDILLCKDRSYHRKNILFHLKYCF